MNYYNEFDPCAAAWLRELIAANMIPKGDVDERSISDVSANDLRGYTQCHFFAGIGGWSRALAIAGWPDDKPVWTGSCPCQPFSTAGKQRGTSDERDLWPEFADLIHKCRPEYVFGEQVENAIGHGWLDRVYTDLETENYAVGAAVLGAHSVGAPHRRQRLYWGAALADRECLQHQWDVLIGKFRNETSEQPTSAEFAGCERTGGVANTAGNGKFGRPANVRPANGGQERDKMRQSAIDGGGLRGVADTESAGREQAWKCGVEFAERSGGGSVDCGVADRDRPGLERRSGSEGSVQCAVGSGGLAGFSPWTQSGYIYCRDGKVRRIPAESLLFGVADGLSGGMDTSGACGVSETGGFPLTTQKEGRAMLLKGYGNAIVPQVAAEFIAAFAEASSQLPPTRRKIEGEK